MLQYSAHPLEQVRHAVGLPRAVPLSEAAQGLMAMARRLDPAALGANELNKAERVLSGVASALRYEALRTTGLICVEGWDKSAPVTTGLPLEHTYRLKGHNNAKAYVTEPRALNAFAIAELAELAETGWRMTVEAAGALYLPGQSLHVLIRPRPVSSDSRTG